MTDRLQQVFEHKRKSSDEFREVQRKNGLLLAPENLVADPGTREGAIELHKGLHWINLELVEFLFAGTAERLEELADVFHFLVELAILAGFDHTIVPDYGDPAHPELDRLDTMLEASENNSLVLPDHESNARFCIVASLQVANILKNKPWKQTLKPPPTEHDLRSGVSAIFYWFGAVVRTAGFTSQQLFDDFIRKESINHERVVTGV